MMRPAYSGHVWESSVRIPWGEAAQGEAGEVAGLLSLKRCRPPCLSLVELRDAYRPALVAHPFRVGGLAGGGTFHIDLDTGRLLGGAADLWQRGRADLCGCSSGHAKAVLVRHRLEQKKITSEHYTSRTRPAGLGSNAARGKEYETFKLGVYSKCAGEACGET